MLFWKFLIVFLSVANLGIHFMSRYWAFSHHENYSVLACPFWHCFEHLFRCENSSFHMGKAERVSAALCLLWPWSASQCLSRLPPYLRLPSVRNLEPKIEYGDLWQVCPPLLEGSIMRCFMSNRCCSGSGLSYSDKLICLYIGKRVSLHYPPKTAG